MMRKPVTHELEDLVRWFITHMDGEMRRQLMAERPVLYKILFPDVSEATLAYMITERIAQVTAQSDIIPRNGPNL
jgi:hypothetical protein